MFPKNINSVILLRNIETGNWHYSPRSTSTEETLKELKETPLKIEDHYSYHGVYTGWLAAGQVANEIHEKEIEASVGQKLNKEYKHIFD